MSHVSFSSRLKDTHAQAASFWSAENTENCWSWNLLTVVMTSAATLDSCTRLRSGHRYRQNAWKLGLHRILNITTMLDLNHHLNYANHHCAHLCQSILDSQTTVLPSDLFCQPVVLPTVPSTNLCREKCVHRWKHSSKVRNLLIRL